MGCGTSSPVAVPAGQPYSGKDVVIEKVATPHEINPAAAAPPPTASAKPEDAPHRAELPPPPAAEASGPTENPPAEKEGPAAPAERVQEDAPAAPTTNESSSPGRMPSAVHDRMSSAATNALDRGVSMKEVVGEAGAEGSGKVKETLTAEKRVQEDGTKFINEFEVRPVPLLFCVACSLRRIPPPHSFVCLATRGELTNSLVTGQGGRGARLLVSEVSLG